MTLPQQAKEAEDSVALENAIAMVAAAMADPSRVKMLCALMDGRAWTATELSAAADIAASTASAHLARLVQGGLITWIAQGRHRYYRLAGSDIAALIENMMGVSWRRAAPLKTSTPSALRVARTCYDHLAGEVAVKIYAFMMREGWISEDGNNITAHGMTQFQSLQVSLLTGSRRKPCCGCLDWSERRLHLGGHAGAALLVCFEQKGWIARTQGYREITITPRGAAALQQHFDIVRS